MLKTLNAVRVLAEFWVVHLHFMPTHSAAVGILVEDLMSFFFVLSGFVMTYTHHEEDADFSDPAWIRAFWWNRIRKMYPVFLVFWILGVAMNVTDGFYTAVDPRILVCHLSQLFMMSGWLGCESELVNGVSWYLHALFWMWLAFPWLLRLQKWWLHTFPYSMDLQLGLMALVSMGVVMLFRPFGYWIYGPLPLVRVVEFFMGGIAALKSDGPSSLCVSVLLAFLVCFYVSLYYLELLCETPCTRGLWSFGDRCLIDWSYAFPTKFAWVWVTLIRWLAAVERDGQPDRATLFLEDSAILQTLSTFSLQLYLGHGIIREMLARLSFVLRSDKDWGLHTLFLAVYGISYACKRLSPLS